MKINHISLNSFSWASYWDSKNKESKPEMYELRIYRHKVYRNRYQLVYYSNKRYFHDLILNTDSKEEMKMTLDLMGLRIVQANIFMQEKSNEDTIIPCTTIYLKV